MLKINRSLPVLAAALLAACGDVVTSAPRATAVVTDDGLRAAIVAQGFQADRIQDHGRYFLVEGDITIDKAVLRAAVGGPRFQYTTNNLVSQANAGQIRVDLSGLSSQPDWQSAARTAMAAWTGISGMYLSMTEGTPADITVTTECRSDGVLARVDGGAAFGFPANGKPGPQIIVNTCWVVAGAPTTPSLSARQHTMVHEFGHTIGFRHSNWNQVDCRPSTSCGGNAGALGANQVPTTPTSGGDPASVMNGETAGSNWNGFSSHDAFSARWRYPIPNPSSVAITHPLGMTILSWTGAPNASYHEYQRYEYSTHSWGGYTENPFGWNVPSGSSVETGYYWTGVSECMYYDNGPNPNSDYFYWQVRAVFPNGKRSDAVQVGAQDAVC